MTKLLAPLVVLLLAVAGPAAASDCTALTVDPRALNEAGIYDCVVDEITGTDEPFSWVPIALGGLAFGAIVALVLLRHGASENRPPRTEDEAWADLLGPAEAEI